MNKITGNKLFWLIFLFIGLLYLVYLPVSYDFDGTVFSHYLRYALLKNDLNPVLQSHHLLYFPVNYFLYKLFDLLVGYRVLEYFHLQMFSLLFGLFSLIIICRMFEHLIQSHFYQTLGVILIACCYGFWYYSMQAEVHMAGFFFILLGIYVLFFKPVNMKYVALTAFLFSLAAGFHLTNGLIAITALLFYIYEKKPWSVFFQFSLFYTLFLTIPYLIYFQFTRINLFEHFKNILFGKNIFAGYRISRWQAVSLKSIFGSIESVAKIILSPLSGFSVVLSIVLLLVITAFIVYLLIRKPAVKRIACLILFWILPFFVFFTLWETFNLEFKLPVAIPILILFVVLYSKIKQTILTRSVMVLLIMGIALFNFFSTVLPGSRFENNRIYQMTASIKEKTEPHSIIMIAGCGSDPSIYSKIYIPYFGHRNVYILDWMLGKGFSFQDIKKKIEQDKTAGNSVYILSELLIPGKALKHLALNHGLDVQELLDFIKGFEWLEKIPLNEDFYLLKIR